MAKRYGIRPSKLLRGSYRDFCLDEAVATAGMAAEARALREAHAEQTEKPATAPAAGPARLANVGGQVVPVGTIKFIGKRDV